MAKTISAETWAKAQHAMDQEKARTWRACAKLREQRAAAGVKPGEGRVGAISRAAVMAAIAAEGPEVMTAAAKGYWDDQLRANPWMAADGRVPGCDSINGRHGRLGTVREKMVGGRWYHWARGGWVPGEVTPRKGLA